MKRNVKQNCNFGKYWLDFTNIINLKLFGAVSIIAQATDRLSQVSESGMHI